MSKKDEEIGSWPWSCCLCPKSKCVEMVIGQRVACSLHLFYRGQAEWSTFPVHKVTVSDIRDIKVIKRMGNVFALVTTSNHILYYIIPREDKSLSAHCLNYVV
ncbi:hypothetical protein XENORESO_018625 [Xenotaenia resolanae]|uniref:CNH domain-containing protein n=1 Tax=Xenotaenia resolanae TaxID=208358 RepID=A0ABV0VZI6_9TELE